MHHAEYRRICSNTERERENGKRGESQILAHRAQGVSGVLLKHFPVLARSSNENTRQRFPPHACDSHRPRLVARLAFLVFERVFHIMAIIPTEIGRQKAQERPKHSLGERNLGRVHQRGPRYASCLRHFRLAKQILIARHRHELFKAPRFIHCDAPALLRESIVSPSLIIQPGDGTFR